MLFLGKMLIIFFLKIYCSSYSDIRYTSTYNTLVIVSHLSTPCHLSPLFLNSILLTSLDMTEVSILPYVYYHWTKEAS